MNLLKTGLLLGMLAALGLAAYPQDSVQWNSYVDSANEIWFQAPGSAMIDRDSDFKAVTLHIFFEGVHVSVTKREIEGEPLKYVKGLALPLGLKGSQVQNYKSDKIYVRRENEMLGSDLKVTLYAGSKKSFFKIVLTGSAQNVAMQRFLQTIRFGGSRLSPDPSLKDNAMNAESIVFETLPTSREAEDALAKKPGGPEPAGKFGKVRQFVPLELDRLSADIIILRKPPPGYTDNARMRGIQGTIFVDVQFLANGTIGNITVDDRADRGLGKNVINAARNIKFIPARANGKAIDVTRTLFYTFSLY